MTQPTVSKHWRRVVSYPDSSQSHQAHLTMLRYICMQNIINLSAAVYELSCMQTFLPYLSMVKNLVLWPWLLTYNLEITTSNSTTKCCCWWQCNSAGDSPVRRQSADHNEADEEAERYTASAASLRSSSRSWLYWWSRDISSFHHRYWLVNGWLRLLT